MSASEDQHQRISRRLKHLYAAIGPACTDESVAKDLGVHGITVTPQYIQLLRTGKKTNPTVNIIRGLAAVFGLPPGYFLDGDEETKRIDDQLALLQAMKKAGVTAIALRAAALDDESRGWVAEQVDRELRRSGASPGDQA